MQLSKKGADFIKEREGLRLKAYDDGGGVWTIGYGHIDGVTAGMQITQGQADDYFNQDVARFVDRVNRLVKVPLAQSQFDALVSFDFNTGGLHKSTLLARLNAGDYDSVPEQLMRWVNDNGKRVQGLVNRRSTEAAMWSEEDAKRTNEVRTARVKPATPTNFSRENIAMAAPVATGAIAAAGEVVNGNGIVQWAIGISILVCLGVGLHYFIGRRRS